MLWQRGRLCRGQLWRGLLTAKWAVTLPGGIEGGTARAFTHPSLFADYSLIAGSGLIRECPFKGNRERASFLVR